tara:strand:+ start:862 stop:1098 length:237 start_codon:yes stop_codon:yes gene_type:complete
MEKVNKLINKVLSCKTWSNKRKVATLLYIDTLLEHDCHVYTQLGTGSTKKEVLEIKNKSRAIYRAIDKIDKKQGEGCL